MDGMYGQDVDLEKAKSHFKFAGRHDILMGFVKIGLILRREGKLADGAEFFKRAADLGDPVGQNNYGKVLMKGEGVPKDYREAKRYLFEAVKQNVTVAMVALAEIEMRGLAGPPAKQLARKLLLRAQSLGNDEAAQRLAAMSQ
jgi:TPR repeat protein